MEVIDAVYRSGLSARVKLTQSGQGGYAPLGFADVQALRDADVCYVVGATSTGADAELTLALATGVMTVDGGGGTATLKDSDGKDVNGDAIALVTMYASVKRYYRAGVLIDEVIRRIPAGLAVGASTDTAALAQVGDRVEITVIGKSE